MTVRAGGYVGAMTSSDAPSDSSPDPKTTDSDAGPEGREDVLSDPAEGAEGRSDWSDEGGATQEGPAND